MIVPFTKGQQTAPGAPAQGMPSETNLLMALATMHEQGRFDQPNTQVADATDIPKPVEDILGAHAQGKASNADVRRVLDPMGYKVDFRKGKYDYEVLDPSGNYRHVQP